MERTQLRNLSTKALAQELADRGDQVVIIMDTGDPLHPSQGSRFQLSKGQSCYLAGLLQAAADAMRARDAQVMHNMFQQGGQG